MFSCRCDRLSEALKELLREVFAEFLPDYHFPTEAGFRMVMASITCSGAIHLGAKQQVNRVFSGNSRPFLPWLAEYLSDTFQAAQLIDMSGALVVLPGGNAMRRLMVLLVLEAEQRNCVLVPPEIVTPGALVDRLLPPEENVANEVSRMAAWVEALRSVAPEELAVLVPDAPDRESARSWLALAERIDSLHSEVSGADLSFEAVAAKGAELSSFLDEERWQVLGEIANRYQQILKRQNLVCRYLDRIARLDNSDGISLQQQIFLAGTVELNQVVRRFLSGCEGVIHACIFAPEEFAHGFDERGTIRRDFWESRPLPLDNQQIRVVESPRDVVGVLYETFGELAGDFASNDITVGVGDETQIAYLRGSLNDLGIAARSAQGSPFSETEIGFFLAAVSRYIGTRTYQHFSALIRHPFFSGWLAKQETGSVATVTDLIACIDRYQERHFQAIISEQLPSESKGDLSAIAIVEQLHALLAPLLGPAQALPAWAGHISTLLEQLSPSLLSGGDEVRESMIEILQEFSEAPSSLELKGSDALDFFNAQLENRANIADWRERGIELMGWLELALDDAPVLLLTSLDEGVVPAVINADPFLPNTLRTHLGLADNAQRLARDRFLLLSMLESRQHCTVVVARRTLSGESAFPSRLLLSCGEEELPDRIQLLYQEGGQYLIQHPRMSQAPDRFLLTKPTAPDEAVESMTVTSFKDYLECPYRFYLRHVARVRACDDDLVELDELNFGTLAHQVLYLAGQDKLIYSHDAEKINCLFDGILTGIVQRRYGAHEFPAIRVQIEQLRERLKHFARWQARHAQEGWKIFALEREILPQECQVELEVGSMGVRGRIDRIDFHESSNRYLVFDYKTGEKGKLLSSVFNTKSGWFDLQMPIYYHAARTFIPDAPIEFAYVNLSARITDEQVTYIPLDAKELEVGMKQAVSVATAVRSGIFWPPSDTRGFDAYDWVLGLNQETDELESESGEAHES